MFFFLGFLWFIRTTKAILFWFYLWQLKEYHLGRFLDHFRTEKGRRIFLNPLFLFKLAFIPLFFFFPLLVFFLFLVVYIAEAVKGLFDFFRKRIKKPVLTKKTAFLVLVGLLIEFLFVFILSVYAQSVLWFIFWLLVFDVLTPKIVSLIVLFFQPLAVFLRYRIIKKAKEKRAKFKNLLVIGITGSYGKTSTKEFLYAILSEKFGLDKVLKTKEHQNSEAGVSQCISEDLKPEHQIFVCEMGAYNIGGIKLLSDIARPRIGVLTGINEQHMATFGSQEKIISAKYELIESLPEDGVAFFNAKNEYCQELYRKTRVKKFLYGQEAKFTGEENILGAMAVAKELGMTDEEISRAAAKIKNRIGGIQLKKGKGGLGVIDATYSANPEGVMAHLDYLKTLPGKKIIVMPCLIELGKASREVHLRIGKKISEVCDLAIIVTKDRFKEIGKGAGEKAVFLENPKKIFDKIKEFCLAGDTVLLEGRLPQKLIKLLLI
jgi:UDP-N-acetylmuramoyl-tripeptide--D-alanyl-D-alanine ligase